MSENNIKTKAENEVISVNILKQPKKIDSISIISLIASLIAVAVAACSFVVQNTPNLVLDNLGKNYEVSDASVIGPAIKNVGKGVAKNIGFRIYTTYLSNNNLLYNSAPNTDISAYKNELPVKRWFNESVVNELAPDDSFVIGSIAVPYVNTYISPTGEETKIDMRGNGVVIICELSYEKWYQKYSKFYFYLYGIGRGSWGYLKDKEFLEVYPQLKQWLESNKIGNEDLLQYVNKRYTYLNKNNATSNKEEVYILKSNESSDNLTKKMQQFIFIDAQSVMNILTFLVVVLALFQEPIRRRWNRAKLKMTINLVPPYSHRIALTNSINGQFVQNCVYVRILVESTNNVGENVEILVKNFWKINSDGTRVVMTDFLPMNLVWSHVGGDKTKVLRGISRLCDFGSFRSFVDNTDTRLILSTIVQPNPVASGVTPNIFSAGKYQFELCLSGDNVESVSKIWELDFDGVWSENEEEMLNNHLKIKEI